MNFFCIVTDIDGIDEYKSLAILIEKKLKHQ